MILWCDGAYDVAENMRRDAALLAAAEAGAEPVLRLFRFVPAGITLGMHQCPERTLHLARCRADGIGWAVRPTGGRAIFHDAEWTYSLAAPIRDPDWGGDLRTAYARASTLVLASLRRLGVPAAFAPRTLANRGGESGAGACFAAAASHELTIQGRKLAGSAQRRTATGLLQQGSILLGESHLRLADYLALDAPERERARETLRRSTTTASPWLESEPSLERWADSLMAGLGDRTRRWDGAAGLFLLPVLASGTYTAAPSN